MLTPCEDARSTSHPRSLVACHTSRPSVQSTCFRARVIVKVPRITSPCCQSPLSVLSVRCSVLSVGFGSASVVYVGKAWRLRGDRRKPHDGFILSFLSCIITQCSVRGPVALSFHLHRFIVYVILIGFFDRARYELRHIFYYSKHCGT